MKNKTLFIIAGITALIYACSGGGENNTSDSNAPDAGSLFKEKDSAPNPDSKGIGKFTNVEVSPTLDVAMAAEGKKVYELKCNACHKLSSEKLVGPGWAGVTERRKPEWIMNFATNPDEMLEKDPSAQAMLEECLVRMPNQQISDDDARHVYEFMRQNDGVK